MLTQAVTITQHMTILNCCSKQFTKCYNLTSISVNLHFVNYKHTHTRMHACTHTHIHMIIIHVNLVELVAP